MKRYPAPPSWAVPGARVHYHAVIGGPPTLLDTTIRSEPWQLGHGEWVVAIVGKAGGVSCQALSRVTP